MSKPAARFCLQQWLLISILLVAAFLRMYKLGEIPPGMTHDEADTGYFVRAVYRGAPSQVKAPYGYANEPFTMYSGALFMLLFGPSDLALRFHSAFFGLLTVMFGYLWVRRAFDPWTALGTAALTAVSCWPVMLSRFALNPSPAPALFTGAMWFLWLAMFDDRPLRSRWWAWLLFALFLAGALWTYETARAVTAALAPFGVLIFLTDRSRAHRYARPYICALAFGLALAAPHLLDPDAWQRSMTLATTLRALAAGNPRPLLHTVAEALATFTVRGDSFITYNVPGRPVFSPPVGLLFYAGVCLCLGHWRRPAHAFTLLWIAAGLLPTMIVGGWTSTLHSTGMLPAVFVPPALVAVKLGRLAAVRCGRWAARVVGIAWAALILATGVSTFRDYFLRWGQWPETRAAYFHNLVAVTDYLDETPYSGAVTLSSPFPDLPLDPFIADLRIHRDDLQIYWCDARRALTFPAARQALLILPTNAPLAPYFATRLNLRPVERVHLRPDDVDPYFDVFAWDPLEALAGFQSDIATVAVEGTELPLPARFGNAVELVACDLPGEPVHPGEYITLMTLWRVIDPDASGPVPAHDYGRTAAIFVHLLDQSGQIVGQEDRLDAPAWNWQPYSSFAQLHQVPVNTDVPPGNYRLVAGLYLRHNMRRLAVVVDGLPVSDHVVLGEVEVK